MNVPLVLLNRRRQGGAFSPKRLFALAEPGVWYDPSDLTTLFQDTAGTTPVTTPGQTVALALDKSKGLVLGPELVTNGDFSNGTTGWTTTAQSPATLSSSVVSGAARLVYNHSGSLSGQFSQGISVVAGRTYRITATATVVSGTANANISVRSTNDAATSTNLGFQAIGTTGTTSVSFIYTAASTTTVFLSAYFFTSSSTVSIDNISVKELPGLHATQSILASRPTYGIVPRTGRRNLLTYTEQFDNLAWVKINATVTANTAVAPDGTTTADKLIPSTGSVVAQANQITTTTAVTHTFSVYAKAAEFSQIQLTNDAVTSTAFFDLAAGTVGVTANATASITSVGSGWYRCSIVFTAGAGPLRHRIYVANAGSTTVTGDGTSGILIWGAQLETGSTATAYQRVGSAFDVTEAGVPSLHYLSFDGIDDFLVTPTITPGIDKAQVFAGVRKLSDVRGTLYELSTGIGSNNGSLASLPSYDGNVGNAATWWVGSKGTALSSASTGTSFAAPQTVVQSQIADISADNLMLRINGTQEAQSTSDQGTGNFLAYPLYIGSRGGTSLPFNGNLFSLIVRFGANLDANTITNTETWVNSKTGAY